MPRFKTDRSHRGLRLPAQVWLVSAGVFVLGTSEFVVAGVLPQMAADLGVSTARVGSLVTAFAVAMVAGAPAAALVTLRLPRGATLVVALLTFAAVHAVTALSSDFAAVLLSRVVAAVATGAFWAVGTVTVVEAVSPAQRTRALSLVVGGLTLANVAGVPLGAWAGQAVGWRGPFWGLAVLAVSVSALVPTVVVKTARPVRLGVAGDDGGAGDSSDPVPVPAAPTSRRPQMPSTPSTPSTPSLRTELAVLGRPRLWLLLTLAATAQGGVFAAYTFIAPLLTTAFAVPTATVPVALLVFGLGALGGAWSGGRWGEARPAVFLAASAAVSTGVLAVLARANLGPGPAVALLAVLGVSAFAVAPVLTAQVVGAAAQAPTLASALATSAFNVGNAAGPLLGGVALTSQFGVRGPAAVGTGLLAAAVVTAVLAIVVEATAKVNATSRKPTRGLRCRRGLMTPREALKPARVERLRGSRSGDRTTGEEEQEHA